MSQKPIHRWIRFSLGGLLLLVTIVCVWLGILVAPARKQAAVVAEIQRLGVGVHYYHEIFKPLRPGSPQEPAYPNAGRPIWLRRMVGDHFVIRARDVELKGARNTGSVLPQLKRLGKFEYLTLANSDISDGLPGRPPRLVEKTYSSKTSMMPHRLRYRQDFSLARRTLTIRHHPPTKRTSF